MTLANLSIRSFRPRNDVPVPLTPRQTEQLTALLDILDRGDGLLRVAQIGPVLVGHLFVLFRISEISGPLVEAWNPERPGLAARLAGGSAYVTDVLVKEGYRRLGIASALMADAIALARDKGLLRLVLHVRPDNAGAMRLYEQLRFARSPDAADQSIEYALSLNSATTGA